MKICLNIVVGSILLGYGILIFIGGHFSYWGHYYAGVHAYIIAALCVIIGIGFIKAKKKKNKPKK